MVDAALEGLDAGKAVTIPALEELALWNDYDRARGAMLPYLSLSQPASRYCD